MDWFGPFDSGKPQTVSHNWQEKGEYIISAQAKDIFGLEGDWGTFKITMPRNKPISIYTPFQWFLQQFPNLLPILQKLLFLIKLDF